VNKRCFIRRDHDCGKVIGASKSCFVACPDDKKLDPLLSMLEDKLSNEGIQCIVAVKDRAYGQDIFCTKICGRIIESRFCLVVLDDKTVKKAKVPNPNVYYEYGLMTALHKYVIPLQKQRSKLAFNIQSHDTIKYTVANLSQELKKGIREAVRSTKEPQPQLEPGAIAERRLLRNLELAGLELKEPDWFLTPAIDDTGFKGFVHREAGFYLFLGKIDEQAEVAGYLEDLRMVVYRVEKKLSEYKAEVGALTEKIKALGSRTLNHTRKTDLKKAQVRFRVLDHRLAQSGSVFFGFVVAQAIDSSKLEASARKYLGDFKRYGLSFGSAGELVIGDVRVNLAPVGI
jgi:hypothetical protein